jgi:3-oxoacyl-[acyl-carrier-protein] synthase-3
MVLTSDDLEANVPGLSQGWSRKYLGMESRRVLAPHERSTDLTIAAVRSAMGEAGWEDGTIDVVLCGAALPEQIMPASASYVARACSPEAIAFDLNAACATVFYEMSTVMGLFAVNPGMTRAVVSTADHGSAWADYTDPHSSVFFGDSGGALLMSTEAGRAGAFEVLGVELVADHEFPERVFVPRSGYFRSDGRYSFAQVMKLSQIAIGRLFADRGCSAGDLLAVVPHQTSAKVCSAVAESLDIPAELVWHNYEWAGNHGASGVVTALSQGWHDARPTLVDGDLVLLVGVGAGYVGGAALLRWAA